MVADKITEEGTTGDDMVTDSHDDPVTISSFVVKECVSVCQAGAGGDHVTKRSVYSHF